MKPIHKWSNDCFVLLPTFSHLVLCEIGRTRDLPIALLSEETYCLWSCRSRNCCVETSEVRNSERPHGLFKGWELTYSLIFDDAVEPVQLFFAEQLIVNRKGGTWLWQLLFPYFQMQNSVGENDRTIVNGHASIVEANVCFIHLDDEWSLGSLRTRTCRD